MTLFSRGVNNDDARVANNEKNICSRLEPPVPATELSLGKEKFDLAIALSFPSRPFFFPLLTYQLD
jgi:hypothetical protein